MQPLYIEASWSIVWSVDLVTFKEPLVFVYVCQGLFLYLLVIGFEFYLSGILLLFSRINLRYASYVK